MDHAERRRLAEIEHALETDDPELAERLTMASTRPTAHEQGHLTRLMIAGACASLLGLLVNPMLFLVGMTITLTAAAVARLDRDPTDRRDEDDDPGGTETAMT